MVSVACVNLLDGACCELMCVYFAWVFTQFFLQAEDGIRDLVRSRGLGDVYKRQGDDLAAKIAEIVATGSCKALEKLRHELPPTITQPVSYTHLTLPPSDLV